MSPVHHWKLLAPKRRRDAVGMCQRRFGVSERRACAVVGQHRSTQRRGASEPSDQEVALRRWLRDFSKRRSRWGWRRAWKERRRLGYRENRKQIRRLWREEGLDVPQKKSEKRLTGIGARVGVMSLICPNALWALDFQFDTTVDGRTIKMLNVIDEYTRRCLAIRVERRIDADGVVAVLDQLAGVGGASGFVRFDNSGEFVAQAVADWCVSNDVKAVFIIDPGSPWQNAWIESFNGKFRDELLNLWHFDSLLEARVLIEDWRIDYNTNRPHHAHGLLTPDEFERACTNQHQPQLA